MTPPRTTYAAFTHTGDCYAAPRYRGATVIRCAGCGVILDTLTAHWRRLYCCTNCRVRANRLRHAAEA